MSMEYKSIQVRVMLECVPDFGFGFGLGGYFVLTLFIKALLERER